jgi:hypothetical protein
MAAFLMVSALATAPAELAEDVVRREGVEGAEKTVGSLGISSLSFKGSYTPHADHGVGIYRFRSEPLIENVDVKGPAGGILKKDDLIVAINGHLITTRRGGNLFSNPPIGSPVTLTIRRDNRERDVMVVPVAIRRDDPRSRHKLPGVPDVPAIPFPEIQPLTSLPPMARPEPFNLLALRRFAPTAWIGFGLSCDKCTIRWNKDEGRAEWRFEVPPEVYSVDPDSPAHRAGLQRGDVLTYVDGLRLDSEQGSQRFSSMEPGQEVTWTYERGGGSYRASFAVASSLRWSIYDREAPVGGKRPDDEEQPAPMVPHLRYAGTLGSTKIEVRGVGQVVVTVKEEDREIIITTSDTTIRLWVED